MKYTKLFFGIIGITALVISSCYTGYKMGFNHSESRISQYEDMQQTFYAVIKEMNADYLVVDGMEINDINFRGEFTFAVTEKTKLEWRYTDIALSDFKVGNRISITFSGIVSESYPAQITDVIKIQLLDDEEP